MKQNLILSLLGLCSTLTAQAQESRPNIILLLADDLGYGDLSCYGAERIQTPTIDSLAKNGLLFRDMHTAAATSTPSRYSILTGEYPWRKEGTNVANGDASMIIKPEQYTLADLFKEAGYRTGAIGKWHLGLGSEKGKQDWNGKLDLTPQDLGFDYHYLMAATADRVPCVFIENGQVANYDASAPIEVSYQKNFQGEPTGKSNPEMLKLLPSHGHNQSIVDSISRIGYMRGGGKALWQDENIADSIVFKAKEFIENNQEEPFFMYLCTNDVHVPRYPHKRFRGKSPLGLRGEAILQFDWTVKELTSFLKEKGLDKNTLLIITSDNGAVLDDGYQDLARELNGSHEPSGGFRGGKYSSYEGGTRVPFIVYWQGKVGQGEVSDALMSQVDLATSLAQMLGVKLPQGAFPDSEDYLASFLGKERKHRPYVFTMPNNRSIDVRTERWKYIPHSEGSPRAWQTLIETGYGQAPQLYDLKQSPKEEKNCSSKHPEIVEKLQEALDTMLSKKQ